MVCINGPAVMPGRVHGAGHSPAAVLSLSPCPWIGAPHIGRRGGWDWLSGCPVTKEQGLEPVPFATLLFWCVLVS